MKQRIQALQNLLKQENLSAMLIASEVNRGYLTNFFGSAGLLIVGKSRAFLIVDSRYTERARQEAVQNIEVVEVNKKDPDVLKRIVKRLRLKNIGIESDRLSVSEFEKIKKKLRGVKLIKTKGLVERLRMLKNAHELKKLSQAVALTDKTFTHIKKYIANNYPKGLSEIAVSCEIERFIRENGGSGLSFESIVAFGKNSARPHHAAGRTKIKQGNFLLLDFGAKVSGYHADMTRTLFIGKPGRRHERLYESVLKMQLAVIRNIKPGVLGFELDNQAKAMAAEFGYADLFTHGLGHGVGLEIHELPNLHSGKNDQLKLASSMTFTVEPGIYIENFGGVRIEDIVILQNGKLKILTKSPKVFQQMII